MKKILTYILLIQCTLIYNKQIKEILQEADDIINVAKMIQSEMSQYSNDQDKTIQKKEDKQYEQKIQSEHQQFQKFSIKFINLAENKVHGNIVIKEQLFVEHQAILNKGSIEGEAIVDKTIEFTKLIVEESKSDFVKAEQINSFKNESIIIYGDVVIGPSYGIQYQD